VRGLGLAFLLLAASASAQTPRREGNYRPEGGKTVAWRIDDNHGLVWGGERYTPVGIRVTDPAAVEAAVAAGVKDLLIDLPNSAADWSPTVAAAEASGARYVLRVASSAPGAPGIAVDPASYRVAGLTGSHHLDLDLPGASAVLVVVASKRDGSILNATTLPLKEGHLTYDTKVNAALENVVLLYPKRDALDTPDLWEGLDGYRDSLLARLKGAKPGPGLRGLIDPLGRGALLPEQEIRGVPTSPAFQAELAAILERKHTNVANTMQAWSLKASALSTYVGTGPEGGKGVLTTTFADLARLVPLWSGSRGVSSLWDPVHDRIYACDKARSQIWDDIEEAVAAAASRRVRRLCTAVRQLVDVPVVQEWNGWSGVTEEREPPFDGMAARVGGDGPGQIVGSAARAVSAAARWSTRGWLVATDVDVPAKDLGGTVEALENLGLRATFVSASPAAVKPIAEFRATHPPADFGIDPVFFPENAANPAAVQRLPGGRWWLPTPEDGNRLDLGTQFFGYRMMTPRGQRVVMWARTPGRFLLRVLKPELMTVTSLDGSDPDPRKAKGGVSVTMNQSPLIIEGTGEVPIPDLAAKETIDAYARLMAISEAGRHVGTDETYAFSQAAAGFDLRPDGAFFEMRSQLRRFAALLSPVAWVEAESSTDTTFSDVVALPGASSDQALALRSLMPPPEGYVANYRVPVVNRNEVVLWVAARLTPERQRELEATLGGQTLTASEAPVSAYGSGFAWYRLGTTRLSGGITNVQLRMRTGAGASAAIDALVFAPPSWHPNGVEYPYDEVKG